MTKHLRVGCGLAALLALAWVGGCASADKAPAPVVPQAVLQSPGKRSLTLSESQSGAAVVLDAGQELVVELPVDGTSGNEWTVVDLKPGVLETLGSKFERALRNVAIDEATGTTVWRLKAQAPGSVSLRFELRRPRSLEPAARVATYGVTVR